MSLLVIYVKIDLTDCYTANNVPIYHCMNGNFANQSGFAIPTGGISFTPAKYVRIRRNVSYDEMAAKARQGIDAARSRAARLRNSAGQRLRSGSRRYGC